MVLLSVLLFQNMLQKSSWYSVHHDGCGDDGAVVAAAAVKMEEEIKDEEEESEVVVGDNCCCCCCRAMACFCACSIAPGTDKHTKELLFFMIKHVTKVTRSGHFFEMVVMT